MDGLKFLLSLSFIFARARVRSTVGKNAVLLMLLGHLGGAAAESLDAQTTQELKAINDPKTQICLTAIKALGLTHNAALVDPLSQALAKEARPLVRRYLVDALGLLKASRALPVLEKALGDPDTQVRQSAVAAIGFLGTAAAQKALLDHASREESPVVKRQLAHHFGLMQTAGADQALGSLSQDGDAGVREMASRQLEQKKRAAKIDLPGDNAQK